jgi:hypothetical protein
MYHLQMRMVYYSFHRWKGEGATLLRTHDSHPNMIITHPSSGDLKHITRKNPNEAHRALGWMMTTGGKSRSQFVVSRDKSKLFAGGSLQSSMQRHDASTTYKPYYSASIGYTLAVTRFSLHQ